MRRETAGLLLSTLAGIGVAAAYAVANKSSEPQKRRTKSEDDSACLPCENARMVRELKQQVRRGR